MPAILLHVWLEGEDIGERSDREDETLDANMNLAWVFTPETQELGLHEPHNGRIAYPGVICVFREIRRPTG